MRFKVTLNYIGKPTGADIPQRVYFVRALDKNEAFKMALMIENVYENPNPRRERTLEDTVIETLTSDEDK
jgi:hypothetical protein